VVVKVGLLEAILVAEKANTPKDKSPEQEEKVLIR
jgi:hypothetical protein